MPSQTNSLVLLPILLLTLLLDTCLFFGVPIAASSTSTWVSSSWTSSSLSSSSLLRIPRSAATRIGADIPSSTTTRYATLLEKHGISSSLNQGVLEISRGGWLAEEDEDEYDDDIGDDEDVDNDKYEKDMEHGESEEDEDENSNDHADGSDNDDDVTAMEKSKNDRPESLTLKMFKVIGHTVLETARAISRAIQAGVSAATHVEEDASEDSVMSHRNPWTQMCHVLSSMFKAAWDKNYKWNDNYHHHQTKHKFGKKKGKGTTTLSSKDFTYYLCQAYGVAIDRPKVSDHDASSVDENSINQPWHVTILGGSLSDAMSKARSQARMLVVFIPSSKPNHGKQSRQEAIAIHSLLSREVMEAAERSAISKSSKDPASQVHRGEGSFAFWSTKFDSKEKVSALKRLRLKPLGNAKNPILAVVYPCATLNASGQMLIVPRVLAQHHCNPPPEGETMAKWLNALRKRHKKQYAKMQHDLKELELFKERQKGYHSSIMDDRMREQRERQEEEERIERERAEKEREEEIKQRRKELKESLAEEPGKGKDGVVTIALRFSDGSRGQRRFDGETVLDEVFNWIDAEYEMERETFDLVTMNGKKTFTFGQQEGLSLADAGLGKMFALRVIKKEPKQMDEDDKSKGSGSAA